MGCTMDDEKVTLRMGVKEIQAMDDFLTERTDLGWTRSQFIRAAVAKYLQGDAVVTSSDKGNGVFVFLNKMEWDAIAFATGNGPYRDEEEFIRCCIRDTIAPNIAAKNANAFEAAQNIPR